MKNKKIFLAVITLLFSTSVHMALHAQEGRYPHYEIPYVYPEVTDIKEVLNRIRDYYEKSSVQRVVDSETGAPVTDLSKPDKNAKVSRGFSSEWSYTHGVVLSAFVYIDSVIGDKAFFANNPKFYDFVAKYQPYFKKNDIMGWGGLSRLGTLDDCGSIGAALIKTYLKKPNPEYLEIIHAIDNHISKGQFRLPDGTLARNRPQYESIWADDMYMGVPFLVNMGVLTGDKKYFDDAVRQILQMSDRLYIPQMELFDHGWNVTSGDYDPRFYWGRANGWVLMAMAETLDILPKDYPGRDRVLHLYRSVIRSLASLQDGSGFWHNLLDKNDTYLETSCTAMFTYAVAKGINEGWISHVYGPVALTGWNAIKTRVLPDGSVDGTCEGTTFAHDNVYYYHRGKSIYGTHGYGPVLYAGAEMIRLLQNEKLEIRKANPDSMNSTFHFLLKNEWPE
ncbi:MAG: glycoside hydrolase family 88 protein [Tannerella sp.]|jgi:rhamnogalacturonyl hydrolase YesR|nr:glycoside hydrolase family 88 protein [Tannerella sp.]